MNSNLFRKARIYTEMGGKEKEAYKSTSAGKFQTALVTGWAGENKTESLPQNLSSLAF